MKQLTRYTILLVLLFSFQNLGDSQTVEGAYGASVLARETVATTLIQMAREAYLTEAEAIEIAKKILRENAIKIYNVKFYF